MSDIPGDFVAVNKLLAQVGSVAVPLIIGDNDRDRRKNEEESRPPRLSRHRLSPCLASPAEFLRIYSQAIVDGADEVRPRVLRRKTPFSVF